MCDVTRSYVWRDVWLIHMCDVTSSYMWRDIWLNMGWLWLVGSIKVYVSFAKEPYKRDYILQKRLIIESILLTVANTYVCVWKRERRMCVCVWGGKKSNMGVWVKIRYIYVYMYIYICIYKIYILRCTRLCVWEQVRCMRWLWLVDEIIGLFCKGAI